MSRQVSSDGGRRRAGCLRCSLRRAVRRGAVKRRNGHPAGALYGFFIRPSVDSYMKSETVLTCRRADVIVEPDDATFFVRNVRAVMIVRREVPVYNGVRVGRVRFVAVLLRERGQQPHLGCKRETEQIAAKGPHVAIMTDGRGGRKPQTPTTPNPESVARQLQMPSARRTATSCPR